MVFTFKRVQLLSQKRKQRRRRKHDAKEKKPNPGLSRFSSCENKIKQEQKEQEANDEP